MKTANKLWIGLAALILLSPLGVILPAYFKAGSAWGEWGHDEVQKLVGYVPEGLKKLASLWNAPLAGYSLNGSGEKGLLHSSIAYIISAAAGMIIVALLELLIGKTLAKKGE